MQLRAFRGGNERRQADGRYVMTLFTYATPELQVTVFARGFHHGFVRLRGVSEWFGEYLPCAGARRSAPGELAAQNDQELLAKCAACRVQARLSF